MRWEVFSVYVQERPINAVVGVGVQKKFEVTAEGLPAILGGGTEA